MKSFVIYWVKGQKMEKKIDKEIKRIIGGKERVRIKINKLSKSLFKKDLDSLSEKEKIFLLKNIFKE